MAPVTRTKSHDQAEDLISAIGREHAELVAKFVRKAQPAQRLFLDDYLFDVLTGKVKPRDTN